MDIFHAYVKTICLSEVKALLGQDVLPFICPVVFNNGGATFRWAVRLPQAWTLRGPLPALEKAKCYSV